MVHSTHHFISDSVMFDTVAIFLVPKTELVTRLIMISKFEWNFPHENYIGFKDGAR